MALLDARRPRARGSPHRRAEPSGPAPRSLATGTTQPTSHGAHTWLHEFIYTCYKLARHYPPDRTVLENISLSFYPGAKIGVIGATAPASRACSKIMAGLDDGFSGEARLTPGFTVGYLAAGATARPHQGRQGNVMDGVAGVQSIIDRYNEVMAMWADADADYDKIGKLQAELEDKIAAADAWSLERNVEIAMDALRCPPDDADVTKLSGGEKRRVALCRLLLSRPDLLLLDEPTNHLDAESVFWLERFLQEYQGTVVAITHDRYFLDNVAQWILELDRGRGIPFQGNYTSWLEQKEARLAHEEKGTRPAGERCNASSSGCACRPRRARPRARLVSPPTRSCRPRPSRRPTSIAASRSRSRPALAWATRDRGRRPPQGVRRSAADRGPVVLASAGRHRRHHRPQRRRQDDAVPHAGR